MGERLLRIVQLETQRRVPERRNLLLAQGTARAGGTLARAPQHATPSLLVGLQTTSAGDMVGYLISEITALHELVHQHNRSDTPHNKIFSQLTAVTERAW